MNYISNYSTLVFDCDWVVLNSNLIKTGAFYNAVFCYHYDAENQLVGYLFMKKFHTF